MDAAQILDGDESPEADAKTEENPDKLLSGFFYGSID
jgi:hypothetical protein